MFEKARLGAFAAQIAVGNPRSVRLVYVSAGAGQNPNLLRGLAGVLSRSTEQIVNLVKAMQIASQRGSTVSEGREPRNQHIDSIRLGPDLDVPGVIGHVGTVLGRNRINIANFSLGRRDAPGEPREAVAVVSTDELVPEPVLAQLRENPAVRFARSVEIRPGVRAARKNGRASHPESMYIVTVRSQSAYRTGPTERRDGHENTARCFSLDPAPGWRSGIRDGKVCA